MRLCQECLGIQKQENLFLVRTDAAEFRIIFLTDYIIRIRAGFQGDFTEESYSLIMTAWADRMDEVFKEERHRIKAAGAIVSEVKDRILLQGSQLTVEIRKRPFQLLIYDAEGTLLHEDLPYTGWQCDMNDRRLHSGVIEAGDHFYGFGERTGELDKKNKFLITSPGDSMGYDSKETDALYKHIPFYSKINDRTKKAVGYFYHGTFACDFNMGRTHSNYSRHHSVYRSDGGDIDLFLIAGPSLKEIIERYTDLTGKSVMLPKTALGYQGSSMYYPELSVDADEAILEFADTAIEEGIPIDGFHLSSGYCEIETENGWKRCTFTWNYDKFKDPAAFIQKMKDKGIVISPNVKPGFLLEHPLNEAMRKQNLFILDRKGKEAAKGLWWGGMGNYVDFTSKASRDIWKQYLKDNLLAFGVTSIWNDNCEYDGLYDKEAKVSFEGKGSCIGQLSSVMSNLMSMAAYEAVREADENVRPYIICRSGHAGIQRYAQTWAGDNTTSWDSLQCNIATILGMSLSGVTNYGCDIGGFYGPAPEEELFVRWVQNGIFQPRFSIHSMNTDNTVTEPWMYGNGKYLIREAIELRYQFIPYLYSLMEQAARTGVPIVQPMVMAFQEDTACYQEGVDFMFGEGLLVANVVEKGAAYRTVYLPKGQDFYDYDTRRRYKGGQMIAVPVTLACIPLFIRSGAIIPMAVNTVRNLATDQVTAIRILCAPDRDGSFSLYEDDGNTMDYKKGIFLRTEIVMKSVAQSPASASAQAPAADKVTKLSFTLQGSYKTAVEHIELDMIHEEGAPYWVRLGNKELTHFLHRKKYEEAESGWYYSQTRRSVLVRYQNPGKDYEVTVSFMKKDLLSM